MTLGQAGIKHGPPARLTSLGWLRARLRARADSEHEMTMNRLAITSVYFAFIIAGEHFGIEDAHQTMTRTLPLFAMFYVIAFGLFAHILWKPAPSPVRRIIAIFTDLGMFSYGMHMWDEAAVVGYPVFLWVILGNGFRFGVSYLALATVVGCAGFLAVLLTTPFWQSHPVMGGSLLIGLIALPAYVSVLIRKLSQAKRQAEEASRAKSMFLAAVSHELRTPLNAIIALSDFLQRSRLNLDQRDMAQTINHSGKTLLELINSILDLSRIEAGALQPTPARTDLYALLDDVRLMLAPTAEAKHLHLSVRIAPGTPRFVEVAPTVIRDVTLNLVGNALKFTETGSIEIGVEVTEGPAGEATMRLWVRDTGMGIAESARQRIFQSFTQADETILDRFGGTGLGLALVKQMIEAQGGSITVDSALGEGSTFMVRLPVVISATGRPGEDPPDIEATASDRGTRLSVVETPASLSPHVFVVSDDPGLISLLDHRHDRVHPMRDAFEALDAALAMADRGDQPRPLLVIDRDLVGPEDCAALSLRLGPTSIRREPVLVLCGVADGSDPVARFTIDLGAEIEPMQVAGLHLPLSLPDLVPEAPRAAMHPKPEPILQAAEGQAPHPPGDAQGQTPERTLGVPSRMAPLHVLVAEDNRTNQKVIRRLLEAEGHRVVIAEDGDKAVIALGEQAFDCVLMDINMPNLNGIEATKLHRFASLGQRRVPIIGLTADASPATLTRCLDAGMDDCVLKPIEQADLVAVLNRHVARPRPVSEGANTPDNVSEQAADPQRQAEPPAAPNAQAGEPAARDASGDRAGGARSDTAPGFAAPALDPSTLDKLKNLGGAAFLGELFEQFMTDAHDTIAALELAAARHDVQGFREQLHALRSGAANVGARAVFVRCLAWRDISDTDLVLNGMERIRDLADAIAHLPGALARWVAEEMPGEMELVRQGGHALFEAADTGRIDPETGQPIEAVRRAADGTTRAA